MNEIMSSSENEQAVLQEEQRIRGLRQALSKTRATVPLVETKDFEFKLAGTGKPVRLSALFREHKDLILVHNMGAHCPGCTLWADEFNGSFEHLWNRAAFAVVSNDDWKAQGAVVRKRGWRFPLVSAKGSDYSQEAGFVGKDQGHGIYNPGVTTFSKGENGKIFRVQRSSFGPGDEYCGAWNLTDLLEGGSKGWFSKTSYPNQTLPPRPGYEAIDDYSEGWRTGDFDRMASAIGPEFIFRGPMQSHDSKAAFMESCHQMAKNPFFSNGRMENVQRFVDGSVVAIFYDFVPQNRKPISMAERMYLDDSGHIREIRLIFDPAQLA